MRERTGMFLNLVLVSFLCKAAKNSEDVVAPTTRQINMAKSQANLQKKALVAFYSRHEVHAVYLLVLVTHHHTNEDRNNWHFKFLEPANQGTLHTYFLHL